MDILIHTLSGTTTAAFISTFSTVKRRNKLLLIVLGAFAGALPDIDAISLWSKFDATIGSWLHLSHTGSQIYFGKFWYSHHGFFHSIFAAALLAFIFIAVRKSTLSKLNWSIYFSQKQTQVLFITFFFSYISHLIGDFPTPGGVWGGIRLFFPFEVYIGGYGTTWWWNNYDVFLTLVMTNSMLLLFILLEKKFLKNDLIKLTAAIYICGLIFCYYFVRQHSISYAYSGNTSRYTFYERTSMLDQRSRLGKVLFKYVNKMDKCLPFYF